MAHDFAKQRPDKSPAVRKRRGAAPRGKDQSGDGHWSWFFTGLFSGLFLAFLGWLALPLAPPLSGGESSPASVISGVEETVQEAVGNFDFYQYLQEAEVEVDVVPVAVAAPSVPEEQEVLQYLLQAGSFQSREDAESRRAAILLLNLQASVVPGKVSGKTWHRVQVGPFSGRRPAEEARDRLSSNNIDTIVLRMKQ